MSVSESQLQQQVADYLRLQYPNILFHSDFGSGVKLTPAQAAIQKRQNGGRRAWPDMFVARPLFWRGEKELPSFVAECEAFDFYYISTSRDNIVEYEAYGLFIELKKDGTRLKKRNGEWATEHIAEQAKVLEDLRKLGYCAEFAVGFDQTKKIIDEYLRGEK